VLEEVPADTFAMGALGCLELLEPGVGERGERAAAVGLGGARST
jgi:hypothetical protein